MTIKVINIYNESVPYGIFPREYWIDPGWKTNNRDWVGIWFENFLNHLGREILKLTKEFTYEVWQPDLRADKTYKHVFDDGLIHKSFPAVNKKTLYGVKLKNRIYSKDIINALGELDDKKNGTIIHLHDDFSGLNQNIISAVKNLPVVFTFHDRINLPSTSFFNINRNILCKINLIYEYFWIKKNIQKIKYITYQHDEFLNHLNKIYKGRCEKLTMGCDFSFWEKLDKTQCRKELNLPTDKFIMLSACYFRPKKQIDKFIEILTQIMNKFGFVYIIIGAGDAGYERYLKAKAGQLAEKGMIKFTGYLEEETMLKYFNSADMFISVSKAEGGPVSSMQAFACELPVFSTKVGNTAELMDSQGAGCIVGARDYAQWLRCIKNIMESKNLPKILDRDTAKKYYDWQVVAGKFADIYRTVIEGRGIQS